jgi:hypothetical protein
VNVGIKNSPPTIPAAIAPRIALNITISPVGLANAPAAVLLWTRDSRATKTRIATGSDRGGFSRFVREGGVEKVLPLSTENAMRSATDAPAAFADCRR